MGLNTLFKWVKITYFVKLFFNTHFIHKNIDLIGLKNELKTIYSRTLILKALIFVHINHGNKGFFEFETIINVLVCSFRFI